MKVGDEFIHRHWLDENRQPMRCVVTAVRAGLVYWKRHDGKGSSMFFRLDMADNYVKPNTVRVGPGPAAGTGTHDELVGGTIGEKP